MRLADVQEGAVIRLERYGEVRVGAPIPIYSPEEGQEIVSGYRIVYSPITDAPLAGIPADSEVEVISEPEQAAPVEEQQGEEAPAPAPVVDMLREALSQLEAQPES